MVKVGEGKIHLILMCSRWNYSEIQSSKNWTSIRPSSGKDIPTTVNYIKFQEESWSNLKEKKLSLYTLIQSCMYIIFNFKSFNWRFENIIMSSLEKLSELTGLSPTVSVVVSAGVTVSVVQVVRWVLLLFVHFYVLCVCVYLNRIWNIGKLVKSKCLV